MTDPTNGLRLIHGLEVVGRGIYLRPYLPYELKEIIFKRDHKKTYYYGENKQTYYITDGYEVNDGPPMPSTRSFKNNLV